MTTIVHNLTKRQSFTEGILLEDPKEIGGNLIHLKIKKIWNTKKKKRWTDYLKQLVKPDNYVDPKDIREFDVYKEELFSVGKQTAEELVDYIYITGTSLKEPWKEETLKKMMAWDYICGLQEQINMLQRSIRRTTATLEQQEGFMENIKRDIPPPFQEEPFIKGAKKSE